MKTRFTALCGIEYPIMQGGMQHLGVPQLAAAVSNAGGIGTINITIYPQHEDFRAALREMKGLTTKPFAVNISLVPGLNMGDSIRRYIAICAEEGVKVIETAGRNPSEFVPQIKEAGMVLVHKCTALRHARRAVADGADAITAAGHEVGGHPGPDEIGTFVLANVLAAGLDVPVLAAGGIADGKGMAAALALGAEGVVVGTRFVASTECTVHPNFKQAIVDATERDTCIIQRSIGNMCRCYNNAQAQKALALDQKGAGLEEQMPVISGKHAREGYVTGDVDNCIYSIGVASGLVHEVKPVAQIIEEMVGGARRTAARLQAMW